MAVASRSDRWNLEHDGASISIAARLPEIDDYRGMTAREKVEFAGRIIRGLFGWTLLIVAFFMALGA